MIINGKSSLVLRYECGGVYGLEWNIYTYMTSIGGDHQSDYNVGKWFSVMLNR